MRMSDAIPQSSMFPGVMKIAPGTELPDPTVVREGVLRPEHVLSLAILGQGHLVVPLPTGVGKTRMFTNLILSRCWQSRFDRVFVIVPTRAVLNEIHRTLLAATLADHASSTLIDSGADDDGSDHLPLIIVTYPSIDDPADAPCHPNHTELKGLITQGLGLHGQVTICQKCPLRKRCRFFRRSQKTMFRGAQVILITEATLLREPDMLRSLLPPMDDDGIDPALRSLALLDEAVGAREGFIRTFTVDDVVAEREVARHAGLSKPNNVDVRQVFQVLQHLIDTPDRRWTDQMPRWQDVAMRWQRAGLRTDRTYRFRLPLLLRYAANPLWYDPERSSYATTQFPWLPTPTVIAGACRDEAIIRWRYGAERVTSLLSGVTVRHPQTRYVALSSSMMTPSRWSGNRRSIAAFAADLLIRETLAGRTCVLVTRRNAQDVISSSGAPVTGGPRLAAMTLSAVRQALEERRDAVPPGLIQILEPGDLPERPTPGRIPVLTFGTIGINAFEGYDTLLTLMAFHVPAEVIRDLAFADRKPSDRPHVTLNGRRQVQWTNQPTDQDREQVDAAIRLLEVDPVIQALGRVRGSIHPRLVVFSSLHDLVPWLGTVETTTTMSGLRTLLGLGSMISVRHGRQQARLQELVAEGLSVKAAARELHVSYATARRLAHAAGMALPRGRPPVGGQPGASDHERATS